MRVVPFLPIAPLAVVLVGLLVAAAILGVGVGQLGRTSGQRAERRAQIVAATAAARLSPVGREARPDGARALGRAAGAELVLVGRGGHVRADATGGRIDGALVESARAGGHGATPLRGDVARWACARVDDDERLIAVVEEPSTSPREAALARALISLAVLLLGIAGTVAWLVGRDATRDVVFVARRVDAMSTVPTAPSGEPLPLRALDDVGLLTAAFNDLVSRFVVAERRSRRDHARARAADRERAAFLAAISHELRSPLNAILGFADILVQEVDGPLPSDAREEVAQIRASGDHLNALVSDILEFSALESGSLKLSPRPTDVRALAAEVVREAKAGLGDRPVVVELVADAAVVAQVDPRRVRQILGNLVGNAIKFTPRGIVGVRVSGEGATCRIDVTDAGPGIHPDELALIFEEYKQAESERRRARGTGLGLAIARRLVALHHGELGVSSEVGRGSTFTVRLPMRGPSRPSLAEASPVSEGAP